MCGEAHNWSGSGRSMKRRKQRIDRFKHYDIVIYAARGSSSARSLATAIGCRRWRDDLPERYTRRRPYFRGNNSPLVVNWGSTNAAEWLSDARFHIRPKWLNASEAVRLAIDKSAFFSALSKYGDEIPLIRATRDVEE